MRRTLTSVAVVAVLVAAALAGVADPAGAHAQLVATEPPDGATLSAAPAEVRIEFDEPVEASVGAVRVHAADGTRVDTGAVSLEDDATTLRMAVASLEDGTHVVAWRAVSADGHPVRGAFVFHVGAPGAAPDPGLFDIGEGLGLWGWLAVAVRWVGTTSGLALIGLVVVPALVGVAPPRRVRRAAAWVAAAAAVVSVPVHAAEVTGLGLGVLLSATALRDAASGAVGLAALLTVVGSLAVVAAGPRPPLAWLGSGLVVSGFLAAGHTRTIDPTWAVMAADAVHIGAAAVWLGGLVLLVEGRAAAAPDLARTVGGVSRVAAWALLAVAAAGLALSAFMVGGLEALTTTAHGTLLVAKTTVVVAVVAVAAYNNRVLVPAILADPVGPAAVRMARTVRWEVIGLGIVLAVTSVMVARPPAVVEASGPSSTYLPFDDHELNLVVDPARSGTNEIHLYFLTPIGGPPLLTGEITLELSLPAEDVGPIVRTPTFAGPGHFEYIGPELAMGGRWEVTVRQRVSRFEEVSVTVPVTVRR